jgi:aquaporin Z
VRPYIAEIFGTFALVFAGTGAIVIDDVSGGAVSHAGIALTFGLVVLAMIYALGDVSGAHLNPAVSIGFFLARRFPGRRVPPYIMAHSKKSATQHRKNKPFSNGGFRDIVSSFV